ncbi:hypothetical protein SAY87_026183 [Trapa incisa]|uniref:Uncharacterized protein n=1 Tax=Trapa incisa TaxID=236973 RepID=A0AAN7GIW3_9MYRT|nr:hypothetical protein SAY87_026183 [Trapa incisa]
MACNPSKRQTSCEYFSGSNHDLYHYDHHGPSDQKRPRPISRFDSVVENVCQLNQMEKLFSVIVPIIRQVVSEEVGNAITASSHLRRSPSLPLPSPERPLATSFHILQLVFAGTLRLPLFTFNSIASDDDSRVRVLLIDPHVDPTITAAVPPVSLPFPIKVEMVVLDGGFPPLCCDGDAVWTEEEFEGSILRPREGRPPLLAGGQLIVSLRRGDGDQSGSVVGATFSNLHVTDNSSWVRSRKFRLGVRVIPGRCGTHVRILEAVSEAFTVRDHRGESYRKHYPPRLEDEVWRLKKIGHAGNLYKNLAAAGVRTVQDFLKMSIVYPAQLRSILGSERNREASVKHAMTCEMGRKHYVFQHQNVCLVLDPICRVVAANIDGHEYSPTQLISLGYKEFVDQLVRTAYSSWDMLEEIEASNNNMIFGRTQTEPMNPLDFITI